MRRLSQDQKLVSSVFTQIIIAGDRAIVYHALFGNPHIVTLPTLELLRIFGNPHSLTEVESNFRIEGLNDAIQILTNAFFLNPADFDEREFLNGKMSGYKNKLRNGRLVNFLSLVVSEACNFSCSYCFANKEFSSSDLSLKHRKLMDFKTAQKAIDVFFRLLEEEGRDEATINFGGGEPLLNFRIIRQALSYIKEKYSAKYNISFVLNTNCSKMTEEIAAVLEQYRVSIATSLDGLKDGNDAVRVYPTGKGTFDDILKGWKLLKRAGIALDGFMVTINKNNFHLVDERLIDFAYSNKMKDVRIDIDVIHQIGIPLDVIVNRLLSLRRYGAKFGVMVNGFWDRPLENLFNPSSAEDFTSFCGGIRGNSFVVNPEGNIYLCGYSSGILGNIFRDSPKEILGEKSRYYQIVSSRMPGEILNCKGCAIEGQCVGGCYVALETERHQKNNVVARNCELYRIMTKELLKDIVLCNS